MTRTKMARSRPRSASDGILVREGVRKHRPSSLARSSSLHQAKLEVRRRWRQGEVVLNAVVSVLVILWLVGLVTAHTLGGLIHVLVVIALVIVLFRIIGARSSA